MDTREAERITPNKALQATGAAPSVIWLRGDSLLPGFVGAQSPAAVPELHRWGSQK